MNSVQDFLRTYKNCKIIWGIIHGPKFYRSNLPHCPQLARPAAILWLLLLPVFCCLSLTSCDSAPDKIATENAASKYSAEDYLPEILQYLEAYAPVYSQAEEAEWMVPEFYYLFDGSNALYHVPLHEYRLLGTGLRQGYLTGIPLLARVLKMRLR